MLFELATHDVTGTIAQLFIYPVKSCAGVELREAVLLAAGLEHDRQWMVIDAQGGFVTQRQWPRMALVRPQLTSTELILHAPGIAPLHLPLTLPTQPAKVQVQVWDDVLSAFDMGDAAAQWFSAFLEPAANTQNSQKFRLVRFDPAQKRLSSMAWTAGVEVPNRFSDGFPVLVLGTASLAALNHKLLKAGQTPVSIERFRPNIVLDGLDEHDEDRIPRLHIATAQGAVLLQFVKPCPRCPIPNIDPTTALSTPEVGDMLQSYRQDPRVNGAVSFGMNAMVVNGAGAVLQAGQTVAGDIAF